MLKPYFRVSNRYVLKKFEMVLFPCRRVFKKETWKREEEKEPLADANAPDLYLPLMACITFVLIIGWLEGKGGQFTPDVLGHIMSISLALLAVEVVAIYVAVRAVKGVPLGWFDTIAYCGYKYVPLCINVLCGVTFGYYGYLGATLATGASYALFSFHTFSAAAFAPAGDAAQFPPAVAATHKLVAIIIAAIEFLLLFVHGYAGSSRLAAARAVAAAVAAASKPVAAAVAAAGGAADAAGGGEPSAATDAIAKFAAENS